MINAEIPSVIVELDDIHIIDWNPREMSSETRKELEAGMEEWGLLQDLVVNKRNNNILGGNQRYISLKKEGVKRATAKFIDVEPEDEVRVCLALNKVNGQFIPSALRDILTSVHNLRATGFTEAERAALLGVDEINDQVAEATEELNSKIDFRFGDFRGEIPKIVYEKFSDEINRLKEIFFPDEEKKKVGIVTVLEAMVVNSSNTPSSSLK